MTLEPPDPALQTEVLVDDPALADRVWEALAELTEAGSRVGTLGVVISDREELIAEGGAKLMLTDSFDLQTALRSGAAVLPRSAGVAEIKLALAALMRGFILLPAASFEGFEPGEIEFAELPADELPPQLTPRELEVLGALAEGASNKVIAKLLSISVHTAKFHVASILQKLGATSRTDAVARAVRAGILLL